MHDQGAFNIYTFGHLCYIYVQYYNIVKKMLDLVPSSLYTCPAFYVNKDVLVPERVQNVFFFDDDHAASGAVY